MEMSRPGFFFLLTCQFFVGNSVAVSRNFDNNGITDLTTLDLPSDLTTLILNRNPGITIIPDGVFQNLTMLIDLRLERIELDDSDVTRDSFLGLISLQMLNLHWNRFAVIPDLYHLGNLTHLRLYGNQLTHIDAYHFVRNSKVQYLDVRNNKIVDIDQDAFFGLIAFTHLGASNNRFQGTPNVTSVGQSLEFFEMTGDLSDFNIVYPNFSFTFTKITHLDIPSSKVTEFPQMTQAHNLIRLNLNNNQIKMLPNISGLGFPEVNVLKEFYFTNNQLEMPVAPHVWTGFPNLVTLDLRNSEIGLWPDLQNATKLVQLRLSGNQITTISLSPSLGLPINNVLKELQMGSNPFQIPEFFSLWANIPHLGYLELSRSELTTWPNLSTLPQLVTLNLAYNRILRAPHNHGLPENNLLTTLHLQGNQEFGVNLSSTFFNNLPRLSTLVLDDCGFTQFPNISDVIDTLTSIFIRTSDIETIDLTALTGSEISETATPMSPLTEFRMPNAKLREFPSEIFKIFPKLRILELSSQKDRYTGAVPDFSLVQNTLENLYLNDIQGSIKTVDFTKVFKKMLKLSTLQMYSMNLEDFPFPVEFILKNFPALRSLDLRNNLMSSIPDLSLVAELHTARPLTIDLRGIRLRSNAICWLLDKTFTDSEMRVLLDGAPCLDPYAGIQWSSLNRDMLDCLGGESSLNRDMLDCLGGILENATFTLNDSTELHSGHSDIIMIKDERSPKHKCLSYCLSFRTCRAVYVKYLSRYEVACAVHHQMPGNGIQGNNTGWELYLMDENEVRIDSLV